jgi:hypothetical protein
MIILLEQVGSQTFKVIPRSYAADSMVFVNETTGDSITYAITPTQTDYYMVIAKALTLQENNFYKITILDGTDEVYRGRVFCTNQTISDFTVNNSEFNTYTSDNEYITYE